MTRRALSSTATQAPPDVVARARALSFEGASAATVAAALNADGLLAPSGRRWHPASVRQQLWGYQPDAVRKQTTSSPQLDSLTGLMGRNEFLASGARMLSEMPSGRSLTMVVMDLDDLRYVNSAFGHLEGDAVLRETAERLLGSVVPGAVSARIGGDAFAVVASISACRPDAVPEMVDSLRLSMGTPFTTSAGVDVVVSMTLGVTCEPTPTIVSPQSLLRRAELAMYHAKTEHLGWATYDGVNDEADAAALVRAIELRSAIASGQLTVHYQPVVDLCTGVASSVEALVRWQHPERGFVPPAEFIPLAEQFGLINELTEEVIDQVALQAPAWAAAGQALTCAINISARSLTDPREAARIVPALSALKGSVTVEVTESVMADAAAVRTLELLVAAGVPCAIDDFGTGYSSLASLKALPATAVKLDRSLIHDVETDDREFEVVVAMVRLADAFGLDIIAEGIETEQAALRLRDAGVQRAQGFWFGEPMSAEELMSWLNAPPRILTSAEVQEASGHPDHRVFFHASQAELIAEAARFVTDSLSEQGHAVVVLDEPRRSLLHAALPAQERARAEQEGRLLVLGARETLALFMRQGSPDLELFESHVAHGLRERLQQAPTLGAYGEMVTLLWQDGNVTGALALEDLWNDMQRDLEFSILCAYPLPDVSGDGGSGLAQICHTHSAVRFCTPLDEKLRLAPAL